MSRRILLIIFWVMLIMAIVTVIAPEVSRGSLWAGVGGYFQDLLANDIQRRNSALRRSRKALREYIGLLKEVHQTKIILLENAAGLAGTYAVMLHDDPGAVSAVARERAALLQPQVAALRGTHGQDTVVLAKDVVRNFRELEQALSDRLSGREAYQLEIDKLAAITENYARGLQMAAVQKRQIRAIHARIRELNGRLSVVDHMNAEKERVAARQEQMMLRARAAEQKARSLRDQLDDMQDDQDEQMERVERLQERMNARMGR